MALNQFGKIAAAEIAFYVPLLLTAFVIVLRHGFGRKEGWIFLFTFSLIRVIGAAITVASQTSSKPQIGLDIAAVVLSGIGLSPLMLATQGFISKIAQEGLPLTQMPLRLIRTLLLVGLILAAVGGSMVSPSNSVSSINTGRTLTRVSGILFMVTFVLLFALHIMLWVVRGELQNQHRKLLIGVSLALPPLFVRLVYTLLGAFAASTHSKWSSIFGEWRIYLTMDLIMEYLAATAYVATGVLLPAQNDEDEREKNEIQMRRMRGA